MTLIDFPRPLTENEYERARQGMLDKVNAGPGVRAIYQIGSVSDPGISDLDLLVVFKDGTARSDNPVESLSKCDKDIFVHNLFGVYEHQFDDIQRYTFYHNYHLLSGDELRRLDHELPSDIQATLKIQTALEFLIRLYVSMSIEREYGILRVRGNLLHMKAVAYDLEFLSIHGGQFKEDVSEVLMVRRKWFTRPSDRSSFRDLVARFYYGLVQLIDEQIQTHRFYLPPSAQLRIAPNISLRPASRLTMSRKGVVGPVLLAKLHPKYFNLLHRFNHFDFGVPITHEAVPEIVNARFQFLSEGIANNRLSLRHYMFPASPLNVFGS